MNLLSLLPLLSAVAPADVPAVHKGLVVHEWGVFRVHDDVEVANADARAEWDSLPPFMYGNVSGRTLPVDWGPLEIRRRPVIFFHSPDPVAVSVHLDFPGGMPGVWWPGTRTPVTRGTRRPAVGTALEWQLFLKEPPPGRRPQHNGLREVPKGHWIEQMRAVKCDEVYALFGDGGIDVDHEKFVFYDGLFPQGKWLRIKVEKERVSLLSQVKHPVHDVTVIDRRGDGKVRVGRLATLDAGAEAKVEFKEVERAKFAAEAADVLSGQLVAAGLFKDEAASLLAACRKDLLETDGVTVFYRLPQAEYDRRLPLALRPEAESLVRVGLVHHSHCEPDFAEQVRALVKKLDDGDFDVREAAQKKLQAMGPAVSVHLARLNQNETSPEVRRRIRELLAKGFRQRDSMSHPPQHDPLAAFFADGATSFAGFSVKKPFGLSRKPMYAVGITG
jgi:hypothetical protein